MQTTQEKVQKDSSLRTRTKTALVIGAFVVVYLLLLLFSNRYWFEPLRPFSTKNIRFAISFFNVLLVVVITFFAARELTNLFHFKKGMFIWINISLFIFVFGSCLYLLLDKYEYIKIDGWKWMYFSANGLIIGTSILMYVINQIIVCIFKKKNKLFDKKALFWYPFLMFWLTLFFNSFFYVTIIHLWTTFLFLLVISIGSDIFGYAFGSKFGKHKIVPKISPKKSWEGLISSYILTLAVMCFLIGICFAANTDLALITRFAFGCCQWSGNIVVAFEAYTWGVHIAIVIILITVSIFGDFFFSYIKRLFNIKDFSNLLPGHGGILDRLDALTFTFIVYYLFTFIIQASTDGLFGAQLLWQG